MPKFNEDENIIKNQWVLERQLNWITNGDVKIGAIVTLNFALLAILGNNFSSDGHFLLDILYVLTSISILIGLIYCKLGFRPHFGAPNKSNIFFGTIASNDLTRFSNEINNLEKEDFNQDLGEQIYRNAQIAQAKYSNLSKATITLLITSILWTTTLGITLFTNKYVISKADVTTPKNPQEK